MFASAPATSWFGSNGTAVAKYLSGRTKCQVCFYFAQLQALAGICLLTLCSKVGSARVAAHKCKMLCEDRHSYKTDLNIIKHAFAAQLSL